MTQDAEKPPVERLAIALQRLGRQRDAYARDKSREGRLAIAASVTKLAAEIRLLAEELVAEAEAERDTPGP